MRDKARNKHGASRRAYNACGAAIRAWGRGAGGAPVGRAPITRCRSGSARRLWLRPCAARVRASTASRTQRRRIASRGTPWPHSAAPAAEVERSPPALAQAAHLWSAERCAGHARTDRVGFRAPCRCGCAPARCTRGCRTRAARATQPQPPPASGAAAPARACHGGCRARRACCTAARG